MTSTIDKNAAFAQTKLAQIQAERDKDKAIRDRVDSGELRDNGNGTFTVLQGWDAGETIRATLNAEGRIEQILADHGITEVGGKTALYSRKPTWHGLGEIVPEGMTDIDDIIDLIGGPLEYSKETAFYRDKMTGEFKPIPGVHAAVWMDQDGRNDALPNRTVGKTYLHAQDADAARFTQDLVGERCVFESVIRLNDRSKFAVGIRLLDHMVVDPEGVADAIAKYLYVVNTHDGSGALTSMVTPWRFECANTERMGTRDAVAKWSVRHTKNWNSDQRQQEARRTLGLVDKYYQSMQKESELLLATNLEIDKFWDIVRSLDDSWGEKDEVNPKTGKPTRGTTIYRNRMDQIEGLLGKNMTKMGLNLYAAERSVTEYLDHYRDAKTNWAMTPAKQAQALLGIDDDKKTKLHHQLLTLARS